MKEVISIVRPATDDGIWLGLLAEDIWIIIKWVLSTHFSISFPAVSTLKWVHVKVKEKKTKRCLHIVALDGYLCGAAAHSGENCGVFGDVSIRCYLGTAAKLLCSGPSAREDMPYPEPVNCQPECQIYAMQLPYPEPIDCQPHCRAFAVHLPRVE